MNQIQPLHFDLPPVPPKGGLKTRKISNSPLWDLEATK